MDRIIFRATGSKIKFPGFMKVYVEGTDDDTEEEKDRILPDFKEGDEVIQKRNRTKTAFHTAATTLYRSTS